MLQVEVARLPEQADLLVALEAWGFAARPLGDLSIEVACDDCDALLHELDTWIARRDLPLVPLKADGRIVLHPPAA